MELIGTLSSQSSSNAAITSRTHLPGMLRAGIATALIALTLLVGFGRPSETAAYKSDSFMCTTLEAGFSYASDMAIAAQRAGDKKTEGYWVKISFALQDTYLDLNCSYSNYEGPAA